MALTMKRRFGLLRGLGKVLAGTAWAVLALTLLVTPVGLARALLGGASEEIWAWVGYGLLGALFFLYGLFLAQAIEVVLAIEENTRQATFVLEKLASLTQQVRDRLDGAGRRGVGMGEGSGPTGADVV